MEWIAASFVMQIALFIFFSALMISLGLSLGYIFSSVIATTYYSSTRRPTNVTIPMWCRVLCYEWFICFTVYPLRLFFKLTGLNLNQYRRHAKPPIILIHGYLDTPLTWWWFRRKLGTSRHPVYTVALQPKLESITSISACVADQLTKIIEKTGATSFHLVGHSMGGLVATYFTRHFAGPKQVLSVTTIGSPFAGTHLARLAHGKNAREMRRRSLFVNQLSKHFAELTTRTLQVASQTDNVVSPWQSAVVDSACAKKVVLEDVGHMALLFDSRVVRAVNDFLEENPAEGPRD